MKRYALVLILAATACTGCEKPTPTAAPSPAAPTSSPSSSATPPLPTLSPNAPRDNPVNAAGSQAGEMERAIAPYIAKAKETYPAAKKRYLEGLPAGHHFFVVAQLKDAETRTIENSFIAVSAIRDGQISGRIANNIDHVKGYKAGDPYTFPESEIVDWLIANPDGSEEGNVVGKFLDEWQEKRALGK